MRSNITLTFLNFWTATIATGPNFAKMERAAHARRPSHAGAQGVDHHGDAPKSRRCKNRMERAAIPSQPTRPAAGSAIFAEAFRLHPNRDGNSP